MQCVTCPKRDNVSRVLSGGEEALGIDLSVELGQTAHYLSLGEMLQMLEFESNICNISTAAVLLISSYEMRVVRGFKYIKSVNYNRSFLIFTIMQPRRLNTGKVSVLEK